MGMGQNPSRFHSLSSHEHTQEEDEILPHIPYDIVIDILKRLPAKTLIRFRCVCKPWFDIIMDSSFITMHIYQSTKFHNYAGKNSKGQVIELYGKVRPHGHPMSLRNDITFVEHRKRERPFIIVRTSYINIVGSCNGLICFTNCFGPEIHLWNPSIRKIKELPSPHIHLCFEFKAMRAQVLGFGFDCQTNDFKVVRFLYSKDNDDTHKLNVPPCEVEVYSLSTNSWKRITTIVPCFPTDEFWSHAFVNGACHWKARKEGFKGELIMSFDFSNEVFTEILPPNCYIGEYDFFCIAEFKKSLSLLSCHFDGGGTTTMSTCCVWAMKKYGMTESWTKQFTVSLHSRYHVSRPLVFAMNGEVLLLQRFDRQLYLYDLETQQINELGITAYDGVTYMDSLALLDEGSSSSGSGVVGRSCGLLLVKK